MRHEIGTIRDCFGQELMASIRRAMHECSHLTEPYYIYFFNQSDAIDHTIHRTTVRIMRKDQLRKVIPYVGGKPVPMLGTGLLKVDNQKGKAEWVWILPRDIPHTQDATPFDQVIEEVASRAFARNVPIINA